MSAAVPAPMPADLGSKLDPVRGPPVRKIKPIVKARGFVFEIWELVRTQKFEGVRGRVGIQERWKLIGVFGTHVRAKNALAQLEHDEKHNHTEVVQVTHFCGHGGSLTHRIPKNTSPIDFEKARAVWRLREHRAQQLACLLCFCAMGESKGVKPEDSSNAWHALLNAPPERVIDKCDAVNCGGPLHECEKCRNTLCSSCCETIERAKAQKFSEDCPEQCAKCSTKMRACLVPGQTWHPCTDCGGVLCEKCCDAAKGAPVEVAVLHEGCAYLAARGSVCNKCGQVVP